METKRTVKKWKLTTKVPTLIFLGNNCEEFQIHGTVAARTSNVTVGILQEIKVYFSRSQCLCIIYWGTNYAITSECKGYMDKCIKLLKRLDILWATYNPYILCWYGKPKNLPFTKRIKQTKIVESERNNLWSVKFMQPCKYYGFLLLLSPLFSKTALKQCLATWSWFRWSK